ncbi:MAG: Uma2 family endonuclease [Cytophagales bacterium]|jgi:Uma2 family endonuclease|nr:Uma2 family endonuclease [Cytophagales bacterium]
MNWAEVCEMPVLQNLPFKIELNEWGNIVMSPASNLHGCLQTEIAFWLKSNQPSGKVLTECSVETLKGVKVADVAWGSQEFFGKDALQTPLQAAPELCIDIVSPSNSKGKIKEKISLYLEKGAKEVWICNEKGQVKFYGPEGEKANSELFVNAPNRFE